MQCLLVMMEALEIERQLVMQAVSDASDATVILEDLEIERQLAIQTLSGARDATDTLEVLEIERQQVMQALSDARDATVTLEVLEIERQPVMQALSDARDACALQDPSSSKLCAFICDENSDCDMKGGASCWMFQGSGICTLRRTPLHGTSQQ